MTEQHELNYLMRERERRISTIQSFIADHPGHKIKELYNMIVQHVPEFQDLQMRTFQGYMLSLLNDRRITVGFKGEGVSIQEAGRA